MTTLELKILEDEILLGENVLCFATFLVDISWTFSGLLLNSSDFLLICLGHYYDPPQTPVIYCF